jgi:hypothetical protein
MGLVIGAFDPDDWRQLVKRGNVLHCDGGHRLWNLYRLELCSAQAEVKRAGELPRGWIIAREFDTVDQAYCLTVFCPGCDPVVEVV